MISFLTQRTAFILVVCVAIIFAIHLGMGMIGNSEAAQPDYDILAQGQDAWEETQTYLLDLLRGNLGYVTSDAGPIPVRDILATSYVNSMGLLLAALVSATLIGLSIGIFAALSKRNTVSLSFLTVTIIGVSTPSFFAAVLLQQFAIRSQDIFQRRVISMAGFAWDFDHMLLPVLVLGARPLAYLTRAAFISLRDTMDADYIRTAYAKGLSRSRTVTAHALRNIAIPVLTAVGVSLRFSLSTLPVVEYFFGWPGMGLRLLEAIDNRQTAVVVTLALALGLTFLLINLLLDVTYRLVDPRTRETA